MAHGGNFVVDKGWKVLSTYNASAAAGVTRYRAVKLGATADTIDLNTAGATLSVGVVQEDVDQTKVATGKVVADVRMMGITKMFVNTTPGSIVQGSKVMVGSAGGAVLATATNIPIGICLTTGTIAAGDLIDVLLTPGMPVL